jgi:hypothetical protein
MASGATAYVDGALAYFRGNRLHSISMSGTGSLTGYPGYLDSPAPGVTANVGGKTTIGRDVTIGASERAGYLSLFNVYNPGSSGAVPPSAVGEAAPSTGLFERQSWFSTTGVTLARGWGRRDSTSFGYSYRTQEFINDDYGDNRSHSAQAAYRRTLSPGAKALAAYGYAQTEYDESDGGTRPITEHAIEGGPEIDKALSRRRSIRFALTVGATRVESVRSADGQAFQDWVPTGRVTLTLALSPTSSIEGGYRRDFSSFQGVTDEVYTTDNAHLAVRGQIADRTTLRVGTSYGNWTTLVASGVNDTLNIYGASIQVSRALTRTLAATASYYYYYHRYSNPGSLPTGFPAEYDRHAVRVGLAVSVPLAGTAPQPQR